MFSVQSAPPGEEQVSRQRALMDTPATTHYQQPPVIRHHDQTISRSSSIYCQLMMIFADWFETQL